MVGPSGQRGSISDPAVHSAAAGSAVIRLRRTDATAVALLGLVAVERGVAPQELLDTKRGPAHVAAARQLAMYLANTMLGRTLTEVGAIFGRDRTTVAYACRLVEDRRDEDDPGFDAELARLERAADKLAIDLAGLNAEVRYASR